MNEPMTIDEGLRLAAGSFVLALHLVISWIAAAPLPIPGS